MKPITRLRPQELAAVADAYLVDGEPRRVLAVKAEPSWDGPAEISTRRGPVRVQVATAPLQMREAMVAAERDDTRLVVLTALSDGDLGHDVLARLVKGRTVTADRWTVLGALFDAEVIDPAITDRPKLADALITAAPAAGWRAAPVVCSRSCTPGRAWTSGCSASRGTGRRRPSVACSVACR